MNPDFIKKLTSIVEANLSDENFGPEQLVENLNISYSTLHRRIKQATGKTISQFIRDIRLEKASTLLFSKELTISEIAYNVGFGSVTYFNRCFHERFGYAPGEYKKKEAEKENLINDVNQNAGFGKRWIWLPASLLLILIVLFLLNYKYSFFSNKPIADLSIAVLPVQYLGAPDYEYQAIGLGEEIKNQLSNIGELRVVDILALKEYMTDKSEKEIGKELKVGALLNITYEKENDENTLFIKLLKANDGTILFSEKYPVEGRFAKQNNIAITIAKKLQAEITPEEKNRMEKVSSINADANDFYQMGKAAHIEYRMDNTKKDALQKAESYYRKAIVSDPDFAAAYAGLARIAFDKTTWSDIFKENYLDTILELANTALSLDNSLSDAFVLLGDYYREKEPDKAVAEYERALQFDPNNWQAYYGLARFYLLTNNIKSIEYLLEAAKRYRGPEYGLMLAWLSFEFNISGLFDQAQYFNERKLDWDDDSITYYRLKGSSERYEENYDKAIEYGLKAYKLDSSNVEIVGALSFFYILKKEYKNALYFAKKAEYLASLINFKRNNEHLRTGYVYLVNGDTPKANEYFKIQIEACNEILKSSQDQGAFYNLAATYAILNQKDKAYENLRAFISSNEISWFFYVLMKDDPLFDTIRNESEFQQILAKVKDKATATRNKLKTWFAQQETS